MVVIKDYDHMTKKKDENVNKLKLTYVSSIS